ncbi:MAG: HAD family hydrolase [Thermoanaerobaculia bacterium]
MPPKPELPDDPVRIAMWSGPRNISTALMRSWGSRADTYVTDEPLYAHYLRVTGIDHPAREEILAAYENDWRKVVAWLTGPVPEGKRIWYQKHMTHHMIPEVGRDWLSGVTNCFLIREPGAVILSYSRVRPEFTAADLGLPQQTELFERVRRQTGRVPPVIDALDVLRDPRRVLGRLCDAVGVPFDEAMLSWEPGPRPTDGVWAPHWYAGVERSTGFGPPRPRTEPVPERYRALHEECREHYERLAQHRLR